MDNKLISHALMDMANTLKGEGQVTRVNVGINAIGSEHGVDEILAGVKLAKRRDDSLSVTVIGPEAFEGCEHIFADDECSAADAMEQALDSGEVDACITQHYTFPIGVATVGRIVTPATGKEVYIATTTGTAAIDRVEAMVRNAIAGIIAAKAAGIEEPTVGILNVEGSRSVEKLLKELQHRGYDFSFGSSQRADGGAVLRGNDLITGAVDVVVTDTLTGNILMKLFSAMQSGGSKEVSGYGYGPGIGVDYRRKIFILSRSSGAPVVANAFQYAKEMVLGNMEKIAEGAYKKLDELNWEELFEKHEAKENAPVEMPEKVIVTGSISGIDILELEDAVEAVWRAGIYAESGMGCTGPIVLVPEEHVEKCTQILLEEGFITETE